MSDLYLKFLNNLLTAILTFRMFKSLSDMKLKIVHTILHAVVILFTTLGLAVEITSHQHSDEKDFYSLHSWVGLATIFIFVNQFMFGFFCYLIPSMNDQIKALYMPIHVFSGIFCFISAIAACLIGLNQNARFNMNYQELPVQGILINLIGVGIIVYGVIVVYLVTAPKFKRSET